MVAPSARTSKKGDGFQWLWWGLWSCRTIFDRQICTFDQAFNWDKNVQIRQRLYKFANFFQHRGLNLYLTPWLWLLISIMQNTLVLAKSHACSRHSIIASQFKAFNFELTTDGRYKYSYLGAVVFLHCDSPVGWPLNTVVYDHKKVVTTTLDSYPQKNNMTP